MKYWERIGRSTFWPATVGAVLYWLALPPVGIAVLGFLAPVAWIRLIRTRRLPGRSPYLMLYLVGVVLWLAVFHFLRLPHWSTAFAWVLVGLYFGVYLPLFVSLTRVAVHRLGVSVVLAAPIVWTGLELAREWVFTGCSAAALGHTQYETLQLIQIADLFGAYGVSFLVMLVAAAIGRTVPLRATVRPAPAPIDRRWSYWPLCVAAAAFTFVWFYGQTRLSDFEPGDATRRIVLIQGDVDAEMKTNPKMRRKTQEEYEALTRRAAAEVDDIDLIVWPETMFRYPRISFPPNVELYYPSYVAKIRKEYKTDIGRIRLERLRQDVSVPMLIGIDHWFIDHKKVINPKSNKEVLVPDCRFWNSAMLVLPDGRITGSYNKQHLVICGEYMPLADRYPWLMIFTPLQINLTPGLRAESLVVPGRAEGEPSIRVAPNICFESFLSRVIRRQVNELIARGESPDVLINMTNDGWFYGSSELDLHLISDVFRAVECRRPFLIAANTGITASIDRTGRIVAQAERRTSTYVVADVAPSQHSSWYLRNGDVFSGICLTACVILGIYGLTCSKTKRHRHRRRRRLRKLLRTARRVD